MRNVNDMMCRPTLKLSLFNKNIVIWTSMVINPNEICQINVPDFNLSLCPATSHPWSHCQLPTHDEGFLMFLGQGVTLVQGQI